MKRTIIILLSVAMILSLGYVFAYAEEGNTGSENMEATKQLMLGLRYDLYTMSSQAYEGEDLPSDETGILLYSPDGFGILVLDELDAPIILRFDYNDMVIDAEGETGSFSIDENSLTLTDSDGWTCLFSKHDQGLESYMVSRFLGV